jgi:hypothetical protein
LPESLDLLTVPSPVTGTLRVDCALVMRLRFVGEGGQLWR